MTLPLTDVNLEGNRLMDLEGLPMSVKRLNVSHNSLLQEGLFLPFPSLESLQAKENKINIYDEDDFVMCFPSLKELDLSQNRLRHTGFLRESVLEVLNLSRNRISLITGLPSTLKTLIADTNEISMIQSRLPPLLEVLCLGYNSLRYAGLSLNWPSTLRELHLDHNSIERFPRKLPDSLQVLTLSHNQLTELPLHLPASLRICLLNHNRIRHIPPFRKHMVLFEVNENCLTDHFDGSFATHFSAENNWNTSDHHNAQRIICACWKRYVFTLRLRHFQRTHTIREELFILSMNPERWEQIDAISAEWRRS